MSKSNAFEAAFLDHVFLNSDIPGIGDAGGLRGSVVTGSLFMRLHTADPGEAGDQSTNEISYTGYAAVALARTGVNFSRTGSVVSLNVDVTFPEMTGGAGGTVTHATIGTAATGGSMILWSGPVTPNIPVAVGISPIIKGVPSGTPSTVTED